MQTLAEQASSEAGPQWRYRLLAERTARSFQVMDADRDGQVAEVRWQHSGLHNAVERGCGHRGGGHGWREPGGTACQALSEFVGVKRRMEAIHEDSRVTVYDDFAHHPTAIKTTLEGLRAKVAGDEKIIADC